jgi:hypothetical protein
MAPGRAAAHWAAVYLAAGVAASHSNNLNARQPKPNGYVQTPMKRQRWIVSENWNVQTPYPRAVFVGAAPASPAFHAAVFRFPNNRGYLPMHAPPHARSVEARYGDDGSLLPAPS